MKKYYVVMSMILLLFGFFTCTSIYSASSNRFQLTAIGDSITYGTGDPERKGYIGRVKERLEEEKGIPVQLNNFGVPRYTSEQMLTKLSERKVIKGIKNADAIILYAGTNDFRQSASYIFDSFDRDKMNAGKERLSANLHTILTQLRKENASAPILVLGLYHPYTEYQNKEEIHSLLEQWNETIAACAASYEETYFVPVLDLFFEQPKEDYFSDKIHLNPAGYQLLAERVYRHLIQ